MKLGIRDKILLYGKIYFPLSLKDTPLNPLSKEEKIILNLCKLLIES